MPLDSENCYENSDAKNRTVTELSGAPYVVPLAPIVSVRSFQIRVRGGVLTLLVTTPAGTLQAFTVSDLFVISNPEVGSEITAIQMFAPAGVSLEVRYLLAGNLS